MNINIDNYNPWREQSEIGTVRYARSARRNKWWGILDTDKGPVWFGSEYGEDFELDPQLGVISYSQRPGGNIPRQGTEIVFVPETLENGRRRAKIWAHKAQLDQVAQELLARDLALEQEAEQRRAAAAAEAERRKSLPIYRITQIAFWKGRETTGKSRQTVAEGIISDLPGFAHKLAKPFGDFSYRYLVEKRVNGGDWNPRGITSQEVEAINRALGLEQGGRANPCQPTMDNFGATPEELEGLARSINGRRTGTATLHAWQLAAA